MHEPRCLLVRERRERDRRRVRLAAAPGRATREQLRPRARDDEDRNIGEPVDELVGEVEQAVVGPVHVLEDEHEGPLVSERLEEAPPGGERLAAAIGSCFVVGRKPGERVEVGPDPARLCLVGQQPDDRLVELPDRVGRRIRLEDARLRLHHLAERPEADALAVGQRAPLTPGDEPVAAVDRSEQLGEQAALADPRNADERHELRRPLVAGALERGGEQLDLPLTPDERPAWAGEIDAEARTRLHDLPDGERLRLSLRDHRLGNAVLDRPLG